MNTKIKDVFKKQILISLLALEEGLFCGAIGAVFAKPIAYFLSGKESLYT
ncbi:MAG: hypothetical protein IKY45_05620 [Clostridia bacterium]|nr:hypothetical protein [Clostridia bacterium]